MYTRNKEAVKRNSEGADYTMSISMVREDAEFLRAAAAADNRSLSYYVRQLCLSHIEKLRKK